MRTTLGSFSEIIPFNSEIKILQLLLKDHRGCFYLIRVFSFKSIIVTATITTAQVFHKIGSNWFLLFCVPVFSTAARVIASGGVFGLNCCRSFCSVKQAMEWWKSWFCYTWSSNGFTLFLHQSSYSSYCHGWNAAPALSHNVQVICSFCLSISRYSEWMDGYHSLSGSATEWHFAEFLRA